MKTARSTTTSFASSIGVNEAQAKRVYRIRKPFAAVQFDVAAKGQIVFLPDGAELRIVGPSNLRGCFEVVCESRLYNVFKADLLGPWASSRIDPVRVIAVGACA